MLQNVTLISIVNVLFAYAYRVIKYIVKTKINEEQYCVSN